MWKNLELEPSALSVTLKFWNSGISFSLLQALASLSFVLDYKTLVKMCLRVDIIRVQVQEKFLYQHLLHGEMLLDSQSPDDLRATNCMIPDDLSLAATGFLRV